MSIRSALPACKFWRGAACSPRWSLDILHRPKGEQRIPQAFRPGKAYGKKIALKGRPTFERYSQKRTFAKRDWITFSETPYLFWRKNLRAQLGERETGPSIPITTYLCVCGLFGRPREAVLRGMPMKKAPRGGLECFQGDSLLRVVPSASNAEVSQQFNE